jgi:hypothetical protein
MNLFIVPSIALKEEKANALDFLLINVKQNKIKITFYLNSLSGNLYTARKI